MNSLVKPVLTPQEKAAGKVFRAEQQEKLTQLITDNPPTFSMPSFISHQRHECPARNDVSTAIELKEVYEHSPAYLVVQIDGTEGDKASHFSAIEVSEDTDTTDGLLIPAKRFGFWYKSGKCRGKTCGATVLSPAGVFVDAYYRPPTANRVSR